MSYIYNNLKKWISNECINQADLQITEINLDECKNQADLQITEIDLDECNINTIPIEIGNYTNYKKWKKNGYDKKVALQITDLDLSSRRICWFPREVGKLKKLKKLDLYENQINFIPYKIFNLTNLVEFRISHNELTSLPKEIGNLINLENLYVNSNKLKKIPKEIGKLINLKELTFGNNKLYEIPKEIGNLTNLEILYLNNNNLRKIPAEIGNLINLRKLYLNSNKLTKIPNEIGNLINLNDLHLDYNELKTIPNEIGNLINITYFNLRMNKLKTIPDEIGNLINLRYLDLRNNKLKMIPNTIINIRNVYIDHRYNPIEYIPPQVDRYTQKRNITLKIYNNNQNVHDYAIQDGIIKSINYIMNIKPIYNVNNIKLIIDRINFINNDTKKLLVEYINCKDVHSILNITFAELLVNVLSFIEQHEAKKEIYKILEQEMNDTICKCFTGRMSRLINCLNGFDDNIVINISNNEQIGNIIILIKDKLTAENNYTIELHKEFVIKELYERGYDKKVVDEWISYI
jgi:Leucine-rich repeat (LRR) protein